MFHLNTTDRCSAVSPLVVCLQPLNPRQAMVKRLSVVNLENFRRQYARRRWKVKRRRAFCHTSFKYAGAHFLLCFSCDQQLSFRIVALCNHLTRIMKKGHKLPQSEVRVVSVWICCVLCVQKEWNELMKD